MKNILTLIVCAFIMGCASCSSDAKDPEPNIVVVDDVKDCAAACSTARYLNCPEGQDLVYPNTSCTLDPDCGEGLFCKDGQCAESCETTCKAFVAQGIHQGLACWSTINSCDEIETVCKATVEYQ